MYTNAFGFTSLLFLHGFVPQPFQCGAVLPVQPWKFGHFNCDQILLLAIGNWQLAIGNWQLAIDNLPMATENFKLVAIFVV